MRQSIKPLVKLIPYIKKLLLVAIVIASLLLGVFAGLFYFKPAEILGSDGDLVEKSAQVIYEKCNTMVTWQECYADEFGRLTKSYDISIVFKTLERVKRLDRKANVCHLIAHGISNAAVARDYSKWPEYVKKIDPMSCNSGYAHGVIEALAAQTGNFKLDRDQIKEICDIFKNTSGKESEAACAHAVGHMVLVENIGDIQKSIDVCQSTEKPIQLGCFIGVFMEDIMRLTLAAHEIAPELEKNWENTEAMEKKCNQYSGEIQLGCWREMAHFYTELHENVPLEVYKSCGRSKDSKLTNMCYFHSILLMAVNGKLKEENKHQLCEMYKGRSEYNQCLSDVTQAYVYESSTYIPKAVDYCKNLPSEDRSACCDSINKHIQKRNYKPISCSSI